ncbi:MAG: hypothetical protein P2A85_29590 (plasmid) [Microcoleus anatoxicus]
MSVNKENIGRSQAGEVRLADISFLLRLDDRTPTASDRRALAW